MENFKNEMQGNIRILFAKSKTCEEEALNCNATIFPIQKTFNSRISLWLQFLAPNATS